MPVRAMPGNSTDRSRQRGRTVPRLMPPRVAAENSMPSIVPLLKRMSEMPVTSSLKALAGMVPSVPDQSMVNCWAKVGMEMLTRSGAAPINCAVARIRIVVSPRMRAGSLPALARVARTDSNRSTPVVGELAPRSR